MYIFAHYIIRIIVLLRYLAQLIGDEDSSALSLSCRFEYELFAWRVLHSLLKILVLIWQNECLRQEHEVLHSVYLLEFGDGFVHQILPSDVEGTWKMVDFLISLESLVNTIFDRTDIPYQARLLFQHILAHDSLEGSAHDCGRLIGLDLIL